MESVEEAPSVDATLEHMSGHPASQKSVLPDRRSVRSECAIRSACIALMSENGLDAVTVGDVCQRADITRGTFYNHYKDKDALVSSLEDEILQDLKSIQKRMGDLDVGDLAVSMASRTPLPILVELFDYLRGKGAFLSAVMGMHGDITFAPRLRDSVCTTIVFSMLHTKYQKNPSEFVKYYVSFFANAYLGIIHRWIMTGMKESSEEMAQIAQRLLFIQPGEPIEL